MFEVDYEKIKVKAQIENGQKETKKDNDWKSKTVPITFSYSGPEFGDRKTITIYPGGRIVVNKGGY